MQLEAAHAWREAVGEEALKPFGRPISLDLHEDPDAQPATIRGGRRAGRNRLIGILRAGEELVEHVVPHFPAHVDGR